MVRKTLLFLSLCRLLCAESEPIYGLMMTGKDAFREKFARISVENFFEQTYPNKKLIIVNHSQKYALANLDERIIEIRIPQKPATIGEMRNIGLSAVPHGALFVNWDDDDYRADVMVEKMHAFLKKKRVDAVALTERIDYVFPRNACFYVVRKWGMSGLMLCRKKEIRYPHFPVREDRGYLDAYMEKYKFAAMDNPAHWYLRFIHTGNITYRPSSPNDFLKKNYWPLLRSERQYMERVLRKYDWVYKALKVKKP